MFNFPTEDIVKAFEAFSEAINQLADYIVDEWGAVTMTVSAVLDDDALWPNRYGMPPKKVRSISSETLQKVIQAIRLHPDYGKKSPLSAESILAKLREFAPVLSNLR